MLSITRSSLLASLILPLFVSCTMRPAKNNHPNSADLGSSIPTYRIPEVLSAIVELDGIKEEGIWDEARTIDRFINPWNTDVTPRTSVSLFTDGNYLYFFFDAEDEDIVVTSPFVDELSVAAGDRVELFFSKDPGMHKYYGFEIDPEGRVLDYRVKYYRKFHYDWNYADVKTAGRKTGKGYAVEGAIPLNFFKDMKDDENGLYWGAYRGEFSYGDDGEIIENWLTIKDPKTEVPDFHVPSSLCRMVLQAD